jgi:3-oxoacyl-[acyl-carrier protein] reductase
MALNDLKDKVAIVTGASKGIGKVIAIALAKEGVQVVLAARNHELLSAVQNEIRGFGGNAISVITDVTSETSVQNLIDQTENKFNQIDFLINNAGVGKFSAIQNISLKDYDTMMDVNLKGAFLLSKAVLSSMQKHQSGAIINIASLAGKNSFAGGTIYSASKWGLIGFARSLMLEVREYNIRVVTICPGSVNTSFGDKERNDLYIIQPEDVAETVIFALSMPARSNVSEIDIRPTVKPK